MTLLTDAAQPRTAALSGERDQLDLLEPYEGTVLEWVKEFHEAFGLPVADHPTLDVPQQLADLRANLLLEEAHEVCEAVGDRDLVAIADGLADMAYVVYGTALTFGIDLDAILAEVHRSNMSKLDPSGKPILRCDGKVLKGPDYSPPDILSVLEGGLGLSASMITTPRPPAGAPGT